MRNTRAALLPLSGGVLLTFFIILSWFPLFRHRSGGDPWRGYTRLSLAGSSLHRETADSLAALEGMEALVSEHSAGVSFNTFAGFERVSVAALEERLESRDPRLDAYMAGVSRYFRAERRGEPWRVLYLKSRRHPLILRRQIAALLGPAGTDWRLDGSSAPGRLVLLALFAGAALTVLAGTDRSGRMLALAALVPWLPRMAAGGPLDLYSFFLLYPLCVGLAESVQPLLRDRLLLGYRGPGGGGAGPRALLLAAGFLLAALLFRPAPGGEGAVGGAAAWYLRRAALPGLNGITLGADLLLFPLAALHYRLRRMRPFHDLFRPLPIRPAGTRQPRRLPAAGLLLNVAAAFLLLPLAAERDGLQAPAPVDPRPTGLVPDREGLSWRGVTALAGPGGIPGQEAEYLPDLADYVTHRAFQEALVFGRPYRLPLPGERVTVSYYLVNPHSREVVQTRRVVKRYQSAWLEQILARVAPTDVEGLLVAQGSPLKVASLAEHRVLRGAFPPAKQLLLLLCLFGAAFGVDIHLTASALYGMRKRLIRRNQHAV